MWFRWGSWSSEEMEEVMGKRWLRWGCWGFLVWLAAWMAPVSVAGEARGRGAGVGSGRLGDVDTEASGRTGGVPDRGTSGGPSEKTFRLTVAEAFALARERNPSLQRSRLDVVLAELAAHRARLDRYVAGLNVRAGHSLVVAWDPFSDPADQDLLSQALDYGGSAVVSIPIFSGGRVNNEIRRRDVDVEMSRAELAVSERELERAVYQAYWTIQGYELQMQAAREGLEQSHQAVAIIQAKVDSGLAAPIELNRFKVDVLNQEQRLAQLELAAYSARQTLARLLHLEDVDFELVDRAGEVTLNDWPDTPGELVARAVENRPELASLALSVQGAEYERAMARAGFLPSLTLDVGADVGASAAWTDSDTWEAVSLSPTVGVTAGLNLSWNLFDNFRTRYQVRQAEVVIEQMEAQRAAQIDAVTEEVRTALETWKNLREREAGVREQLALATDNLEILETLYGQGTASLLDLLNAQSEYRNALTQAAAFQVDIVTAEFDLRWNVGESLVN